MDFRVIYTKKFALQTFINFCKVCLKGTTEGIVAADLKRCGACRMLFYCSEEHQRQDWSNHKDFCKAIQAVKLYLEITRSTRDKTYNFLGILSSFEGDNTNDWMIYRRLLMEKCIEELGRPLRYDEEIYFFFPTNCKLCYKAHKKMVYCQSCPIMSYCSEAHKEQDKEFHSQVCGSLKLVIDLYQLSEVSYVSISRAEAGKKLNKSMEDFLQKRLYVKTEPQGREHLNKIILSDSFTLPLTMIYVIDRCGILKSEQKNKLTVHFFNWGSFENNCAYVWEYIFHQFKKLIYLNFVIIGPTCKETFFEEPKLSCDKCKNKTLVCSYHESDYNNFIKTNKDTPDLIFGYHNSFGELEECKANTWKKTFRKMLSFRNTVIVFTENSKTNAEGDLNLFKQCSTSDRYTTIAETEENPFRSMLPIRDFRGSCDLLVYSNNYINIIKTN